MQWLVRSERSVFKDQWVDLREADVELPDGRHLNHKVLHTAAGAGAVVVNEKAETLLLWRHRFINDTWAYEIPFGKIDDGEEPIEAARREFLEETGWQPGPLRPLVCVQPATGLLASRHHVFYGTEATRVADVADDIEAERIEWVPLASVRSLIADGRIVCGTTMAALLMTAGTVSPE